MTSGTRSRIASTRERMIAPYSTKCSRSASPSTWRIAISLSHASSSKRSATGRRCSRKTAPPSSTTTPGRSSNWPRSIRDASSDPSAAVSCARYSFKRTPLMRVVICAAALEIRTVTMTLPRTRRRDTCASISASRTVKSSGTRSVHLKCRLLTERTSTATSAPSSSACAMPNPVIDRIIGDYGFPPAGASGAGASGAGASGAAGAVND